MTEYRQLRMSHILDDPELKKLFKKKGWVRVCSVCGEFVGNNAHWIEHTVKTHMEMEPAVVEPNARKQQILFRQNRHDDGSGWIVHTVILTHMEMEPAEVEPDEESVLSEEESGILPQYRSWSRSSYYRRAY